MDDKLADDQKAEEEPRTRVRTWRKNNTFVPVYTSQAVPSPDPELDGSELGHELGSGSSDVPTLSGHTRDGDAPTLSGHTVDAKVSLSSDDEDDDPADDDERKDIEDRRSHPRECAEQLGEDEAPHYDTEEIYLTDA